jgi:cobalt transporter subunit CbtB
MSDDTLAGQHARDRGRLAGLWPAVAAIACGFAVVYGAGLAGAGTIHDAAHDARHRLDFPCH